MEKVNELVGILKTISYSLLILLQTWHFNHTLFHLYCKYANLECIESEITILEKVMTSKTKFCFKFFFKLHKISCYTNMPQIEMSSLLYSQPTLLKCTFSSTQPFENNIQYNNQTLLQVLLDHLECLFLLWFLKLSLLHSTFSTQTSSPEFVLRTTSCSIVNNRARAYVS